MSAVSRIHIHKNRRSINKGSVERSKVALAEALHVPVARVSDDNLRVSMAVMLCWMMREFGGNPIGTCSKYGFVTENVVYPYTQWLMIIIPIKWLFHWEYTLFSDKPKYATELPHMFNIAEEWLQEQKLGPARAENGQAQ